MKKTLLLFGFMCVLGAQSMTFAEIPVSRHGAICVLDDDDDEMSMEEMRALERMPEVKQSVIQEFIAGYAVTLLGWYLNYREFVKLLARKLPKRKFNKRRA